MASANAGLPQPVWVSKYHPGTYRVKTFLLSSAAPLRRSASGLRKRRSDALGQDTSRVLIERAGLRKALDGLQNLGIVFEFDLFASGQAEYRDEDFFLDLPLDPIAVGGKVRIAVVDIVLIQIAPEGRENAVIYLEIFCDLRLGAEKIGGEIADASLEGKENVAAKQGF